MLLNHPMDASEREFILHALNSTAIVAITDIRGTIVLVNQRFTEISGYSEQELLGQNHRMLQSGQHSQDFFRAMYATIAKGKIWRDEICNRRKDGTLYWVATTIVPYRSLHGRIERYISIRFDITDRKFAETHLRDSRAALRAAVITDPLTGLINRREFSVRLTQSLALASNTGTAVALALLDVDHFKTINDFYGHDAGDTLLIHIADRLRNSALAPIHFVARLGGDEFAIALDNETAGDIDQTLEHILNLIRQPIEINGVSHHCTASIGYASYPQDGESEKELFKCADLALYEAKAQERNRVIPFVPRLRAIFDRRIEFQQAVETGLRMGQFAVHYQPIVPLSGQKPLSLEALLRWHHPQLGLITPQAFGEIFEEPSTAVQIGHFILERAISDIATMRARAIRVDRISINVTAADFRNHDFTARLTTLLGRYAVSPEQICIEVTETMFLDTGSTGIQQDLQQLHDLGVKIALDDFGTGYASLTHLVSLPFDIVKIDRSFTSNITRHGPETVIVQGVIDIVRGIGRSVIAEGIETLAQLEQLNTMGCDTMQGWFFSRACPPEDLETVMNSVWTQLMPLKVHHHTARAHERINRTMLNTGLNAGAKKPV